MESGAPENGVVWDFKRTGVFTDQSMEQLQVLFPDVQEDATVILIHLRAACKTQGSDMFTT